MYSYCRINNIYSNDEDTYWNFITWNPLDGCSYFYTSRTPTSHEIPPDARIIRGSWDISLDELLINSLWGTLVRDLINDKMVNIKEDEILGGYFLEPIKLSEMNTHYPIGIH